MPARPIFYDTETTGVRSDKDRIIEIAAIDVLQNRTFVQFVNPGISIPKEATAIHQITDEMVKDAPSWKEIGKSFAEFCAGDIVLIAHNNDSFDQLFLQEEYKRAGLEMPQWKFIDSLKWSRKYRSDLPRHTLQSLRELYQIPANQAHRALDDVVVLSQVFSHMTDDLPMEKIIELLSVSSQTMRMPFGKHQGKPLSLVPKDYVAWLNSSGSFDRTDNKDLKLAFEKLGLLP
jgi:DNA polymerase-3 subunit epsilon